MTERESLESRYPLDVCKDLEKVFDFLKDYTDKELKNIFKKEIIEYQGEQVEVIGLIDETKAQRNLSSHYGQRLAGLKIDVEGNTYSRIGYKELKISAFLKHREVEDSKKDFVKKLFTIMN